MNLANGRGVVWTDDEADNLGDWFEQNSGLSQKSIEEKYYLDTSIWRSYSSLQTKLYFLGLGHLSHKKRKPSPADNARETRPVLSTSSEKSTVDPTQFSLAMRRIMGAWEAMKSSDDLNDEVESSSSCFENTQGNMVDAENSFRPSLDDVGDVIALRSRSQYTHSSASFSRQTHGDANDEGFTTGISSPIQSEQPKPSQEQTETNLMVGNTRALPERSEEPGVPEVPEVPGVSEEPEEPRGRSETSVEEFARGFESQFSSVADYLDGFQASQSVGSASGGSLS